MFSIIRPRAASSPVASPGNAYLSGRRTHGDRRRAFCPCVLECLEGRIAPATFRVTSLLNSGPGTLRAAIEQADHSHGSDTIRFAHSATGTIALLSALPDLTAHLAIVGPGPSALTVARSSALGTPAFRIFTVSNGAKVSITGLTITNGSAADGGGIENSGTLSVTDATFSGNSAMASGNAPADGGAIANSGMLSVADCTFSGNSAAYVLGEGSSTEGHGSGGGIENSGTLSVSDATFSGNSAMASGYSAADGGGIASSGTLSVAASTFSGNSATDISVARYGADGAASGGGIENSGTLSITNTMFSGNSTTGSLPGFGGAIGNNGTLSVSNSTLSGNSVTGSSGGSGGGIANSGTLAVNGSTFSGNAAICQSCMSGVGSDGGGIFNGTTLSIANSTFSGNSATGSSSSAGGAIATVGSASIYYITAADNSAASGGGIASGITLVGAGQSNVTDSIFQNTQGGNVSAAAGGVFDSLGHNLFSDDPDITLAPPTWSTPTRCSARLPTMVGRPSQKPSSPAARPSMQEFRSPALRPISGGRPGR